MSYTRLFLSRAAIALLPCVLSGGTIITSNLPANTAIINIDSRAYGSAQFNGQAQSQWFHPFNTSNSLLEYTVQPGTYQFRVVNPTDAAGLFPALTGPQLSNIFTAWTFNTPWLTDYLVFDSAAASNFGLSQLLAGAIAASPFSSSASAAYDLAKTNGYYNQLIIGDILSGPKVTQYTFNAPETLIFAIPDSGLPDNTGGVSVLISPAVAATAPEPGAMSLMLAGMGALGLLVRRLRAGVVV